VTERRPSKDYGAIWVLAIGNGPDPGNFAEWLTVLALVVCRDELAENRSVDASGCEESGRRRCYGNWGTQTSRTQGTSISRRLVAKRADASPKICSRTPPQPAARHLARPDNRLGTRAAGPVRHWNLPTVPTVRILSISYHSESNATLKALARSPDALVVVHG
jgi:hypothetical protein